MHPYDIMLIISIACAVGFTSIIYVEDDLVLALWFIPASSVGAVAGGYLAFWYVPIQDQFAIIFGGFLGSVLLVLTVLIIRRYQR